MAANVEREPHSRTVWFRHHTRHFYNCTCLIVVVLLTVSIHFQFTSGLHFQKFPGFNFTCQNATFVTACGSVTLCGYECSQWADCSGFSVLSSADSARGALVCRLCWGNGDNSNGIAQSGNEAEDDLWVKRTTFLLNPPVETFFDFPNGLKIGQLVQFWGVPTTAFSFDVKFKNDPWGIDVPIILNVVFNNSIRVVNRMTIYHIVNRTFVVDVRRTSDPFKVGKRFEIIVLVMPSKYRFYFDRQVVFDLDFHPLSPDGIRLLIFKRDVKISHVIV